MLVGIGAISKLNHVIKLGQEKQKLQDYGVGESIQIDGKNANLYQMGNQNSDGTMVYLHGLGMGDTTVSTRHMFKNLENDYRICVIDRFGNGMSDDTSKKQTVNEIVEFYRTILKKSNQKIPYILIAHSISGMYATYWAQHYPEEIKAIIYLDAEPAENYKMQGKPDFVMMASSQMEWIASKLGFQRFFMSETALLGKAENQVFSKNENEMRKYLIYQNSFSSATFSEIKCYYENATCVLDGNVTLDLPQLYIVANNTIGKYYEDVYKEDLNRRFKGNQKRIQEKTEERRKIIQKKEEIMKKRGNVEIVEISGPHCLYEYAPKEIATEITKFLRKRQ